MVMYLKAVADPENQWVDGAHGEKPIFEAYSRRYNPYFFVFLEEKWKNKIPNEMEVAESPTAESATV